MQVFSVYWCSVDDFVLTLAYIKNFYACGSENGSAKNPTTVKLVVFDEKIHNDNNQRYMTIPILDVAGELGVTKFEALKDMIETERRQAANVYRRRVQIQVNSSLLADTLSRIPPIEWAMIRGQLLQLRKKSESSSYKYDIHLASQMLGDAVRYYNDRIKERAAFSGYDFSFQVFFPHPIPGSYLPLLIFANWNLIRAAARWSANSSIYYIRVNGDRILELTPYGVCDATYFWFNPNSDSFVAYYQDDEEKVPAAVDGWETRLALGKPLWSILGD